MVILQSSKVLIYAWTVHVKFIIIYVSSHSFLREFDITYWLKTFYLVEHQLDSFFAPKVDRSFCPVILRVIGQSLSFCFGAKFLSCPFLDNPFWISLNFLPNFPINHHIYSWILEIILYILTSDKLHFWWNTSVSLW